MLCKRMLHGDIFAILFIIKLSMESTWEVVIRDLFIYCTLLLSENSYQSISFVSELRKQTMIYNNIQSNQSCFEQLGTNLTRKNFGIKCKCIQHKGNGYRYLLVQAIFQYDHEFKICQLLYIIDHQILQTTQKFWIKKYKIWRCFKAATLYKINEHFILSQLDILFMELELSKMYIIIDKKFYFHYRNRILSLDSKKLIQHSGFLQKIDSDL